jgi:hypothetical protein
MLGIIKSILDLLFLLIKPFSNKEGEFNPFHKDFVPIKFMVLLLFIWLIGLLIFFIVKDHREAQHISELEEAIRVICADGKCDKYITDDIEIPK